MFIKYNNLNQQNAYYLMMLLIHLMNFLMTNFQFNIYHTLIKINFMYYILIMEQLHILNQRYFSYNQCLHYMIN